MIRRKLFTWTLIIVAITAVTIWAFGAFADDQKTVACSISVDAATPASHISPLLFGNNILWSDGQYVVNNPAAGDLNFRPEIEKFSQELGVSIIRFPGGSLSETYHWRNCVGPLSQRQKNEDSYGRFYVPYVGTDESFALCESTGCQEKLVTVNYCTGTPQEAANWVEYCNSPVPVNPDPTWDAASYKGDEKAPKGYFAWLRSKFGHPNPYGVKYWEIGNEVYCRDDLKARLTPGHGLNADDYGKAVVKYAKAMKAVDPSIKIGTVSVDGGKWANWNDTLLREAAQSIDFICPHYYSSLRALTFETFYRSPANDAKRESTRKIKISESGQYTFTTTARAKLASDQPSVIARMELWVDGKLARNFGVGMLPAKYEYTCDLTKGEHEVSLLIRNHYWNKANSDTRYLLLYDVTMRSSSLEEKSIWYPQDAEQQILFNDSQVIGERIRKLKSVIQKSSNNKIEIAVTEGGLNYPSEGSVKNTGYPMEEVRHALRYKAALWQSALLNTLIREEIPIYCHWVLFDDGHYGLIRDPNFTLNEKSGKAQVTPVYYLMQMYTRLAGMETLGVDVKCPTFKYAVNMPVPPVYDGTDYSLSLPRPSGVPYLDAVACRSADGKSIILLVTNRSEKTAITNINISGFTTDKADVRTLHVKHMEKRADKIVGNMQPVMEAHMETKTLDKHRIQPDNISVDVAEIKGISSYTFEPYSVTMIEFHK